MIILIINLTYLNLFYCNLIKDLFIFLIIHYIPNEKMYDSYIFVFIYDSYNFVFICSPPRPAIFKIFVYVSYINLWNCLIFCVWFIHSAVLAADTFHTNLYFTYNRYKISAIISAVISLFFSFLFLLRTAEIRRGGGYSR